MTNHLYYGDNLDVLRESICDESVDLIYLDPPFNSNATYNILYREPSGEASQAQIEAGRGETNKQAIRFGVSHDVLLYYARADNTRFNRQSRDSNPDYIDAKFVHVDKDGRRYRLDNLTSPSCRPTLIYSYKGYSPPEKGWAVSLETMQKMDAEGRVYFPDDGNKRLQRIRYLDELEGETVDTLWDDIAPINSQAQERLGYPTQKPLALLERIISASSNEGGVVLDPFCGCGTTVHAAQKLKRTWIGVDVTHLAISVIERRLRDAFPGIEFDVHGSPKDLAGARDLAAREKHQFEWWAVSLVNAMPRNGKKKGADGGIDGVIFFRSGAKTTEKAIVSVKGGGIGVKDVRELANVVDRERAKVGVFISLEAHTQPMVKEAAGAGLYEGLTGKVPKIQLFTIEELFEGKRPRIPLVERAFKVTGLEETEEQFGMDL